jgi:hypothetical protein
MKADRWPQFCTSAPALTHSPGNGTSALRTLHTISHFTKKNYIYESEDYAYIYERFTRDTCQRTFLQQIVATFMTDLNRTSVSAHFCSRLWLHLWNIYPRYLSVHISATDCDYIYERFTRDICQRTFLQQFVATFMKHLREISVKAHFCNRLWLNLWNIYMGYLSAHIPAADTALTYYGTPKWQSPERQVLTS